MLYMETLKGPETGLGECSKDTLIDYLSARVEALEKELNKDK